MNPPVYKWQIDARCPGSASWAVLNEAGAVIACHVAEQDARRDAALRMGGLPVAAGLGVPQDLPGVTPATGEAYKAPMQGGSLGGGAQPGAVLTPDAGGPRVAASMGPLAGKGGGWTAGRGLDLPEVETRTAIETWPLADLEIRTSDDGMHFTGYAAVFDTPSLPLQGGKFTETIAPGAFSRSLAADRDIRMFLNHDTGKLLGTRKAGTLRLSEDSRGLLVDADLPDTTAGRDLAVLAKRGDVDSMSFTFKKVRDKWTDGGSRRSLDEVKLFEVSPMTEWAAYPTTSAAVRSLAGLVGTIEANVKRAYSSSANDAAQGASILSSLLYLLSSESDDPGQVSLIQQSIDALSKWLDAERAEIGTEGDAGDSMMRRIPLSVVKRRLALLEF